MMACALLLVDDRGNFLACAAILILPSNVWRCILVE
jgi:hypothetical protein